MSSTPDRLLWIGLAGTDPGEAAARVRNLRPGGVVLFRRNVETPQQMHALIAAVREEAGASRLAVALDQEGGRVDRLRDLLGPSPPARRLAQDGARAARAFGALTGRALRLLGVDVDFAPVLDLDYGREEGAIGDRSWGERPQDVVERAGAFLEGLESEGIRSCLKHWPGLGRAASDPHHGLPRVEAAGTDMAADQSPFYELFDSRRFVMTAHCLYPALGATDVPATCCREALAPLRSRGFTGALIADDLEMGAIGGEIGSASRDAIRAGCDILLLCGRDDGAARAAREALRRADDLGERIREAVRRTQRTLGEPLGSAPFDPVEWEELRADYREFCDPLLEREGDGPDPTERA